MRKIALVVLMALFAASSLTAASVPAFADKSSKSAKKKDRPGQCGTLNYYDKKQKKCVSAVK
jgi:hypothetical protein